MAMLLGRWSGGGGGRAATAASYSTATLKGIVSSFPAVDFAMAYGSGVMHHGSNDAMVDLIFGVRDPISWHDANMSLGHAHHYSWAARAIGSHAIAAIQSTAAGLHFNPLVQWDRDTVVKYGVISLDDLCLDLQNWTTLYVSGRLHKPATIIHAPIAVRGLLRRNWSQALHTALLLLPSSRFTDRDLYHAIAGLSYAGDIRMKLGFAENPRKVPDIVQANFHDFKRLYGPYLADAQHNGYVVNQERPASSSSSSPSEREGQGADFVLNLDLSSARSILSQLPERVRQLCYAELHPKAPAALSTEPAAWTCTNLAEMRRALSHAIGRIGLEATFWQSLKGLYTAGITKSIAYAYRKSVKSLQR